MSETIYVFSKYSCLPSCLKCRLGANDMALLIKAVATKPMTWIWSLVSIWWKETSSLKLTWWQGEAKGDTGDYFTQVTQVEGATWGTVPPGQDWREKAAHEQWRKEDHVLRWKEGWVQCVCKVTSVQAAESPQQCWRTFLGCWVTAHPPQAFWRHFFLLPCFVYTTPL